MRRAWIERALILFSAASLVLASGPAAEGKPGSAGDKFEGALVRCAEVTQPAVLAGCGSDPLVSGKAEIQRTGAVEVLVAGATASVSYDVVYRSLDGTTELAIGTLATNASGNGALEKKGFFALGAVGSGNIVLKRLGADQFATGFKVGTDDAEFEGGLVRCADVTQPAALAGCGTDALGSGKGEIEEDGKVEVKVSGAAPSVSYDVVYRSLDGATELAVGTLTTDSQGRGELEVSGFFAAGVQGAGNLVLRRLGLDQFVTGFRVSGAAAGMPANFSVGLVRCVEVTKPGPLANCGLDALFKGFAMIKHNGDVMVVLVGAEPNMTYDVVYRSLDGITQIAVGSLTTGAVGNANFKAKDFFSLGDVGSGNIVLMRGGLDQFVTGFRTIN